MSGTPDDTIPTIYACLPVGEDSSVVITLILGMDHGPANGVAASLFTYAMGLMQAASNASADLETPLSNHMTPTERHDMAEALFQTIVETLPAHPMLDQALAEWQAAKKEQRS